MKLIPIIDNGHGGMVNGKYVTPGKRGSYLGKNIYEGVYNRYLARAIMRKLDDMGIPYYYLHGGDDDLSLTERVKRANSIYSNNRSTYVLSIHLNAGGGTGWEVWTSVGQTESDSIATVFHKHAVLNLANERMRTDTKDGDPDKESQFYILKHTKCPAVLTENMFMDNPKDFKKLDNDTFFKKLVMLHVKAIIEMWK